MTYEIITAPLGATVRNSPSDSRFMTRPPEDDSANEDFLNTITPVSEPSEEDVITKKGGHAQVREREVDSDSDDVRPRPASKLPDWRPKTLERLPDFALKTVLVYMIFYLVIWGATYHRKYITTTSIRKDWFFRYGPVFLALIVTEMVSRYVTPGYNCICLLS